MNNFIRVAKERWDNAKKTTKRAKERFETLSQLPAAFIEHDWGDATVDVTQTGTSIGLDISLYSGSLRTQELVDEVKEYLGNEIGFSFERVEHMYEEAFRYVGQIDINGVTVSIALRCAPKPPNCTLTKITTTEEVTHYEAVCDDTGEEI